MFNKKRFNKIMAKIVWNIMRIFTVLSLFVLLLSVGIMIEELNANKTLVIIFSICLVWIILFSRFVSNANSKKN